jgi:hypothetical protein
LSVLGGAPGLSFSFGKARRTAAGHRLVALIAYVLLAATAGGVLLIGFAGCGESEGVAEGATVTAYVEASLCSGAKQQLATERGHAGDIRVRAVCLPSPDQGRNLDLATVGANARQATQDSTTVGFLEAQDPSASRFTHPILESASIAWITSSSGKAAMAQLLQAIEAADPGSLRESVQEALHEQ